MLLKKIARKIYMFLGLNSFRAYLNYQRQFKCLQRQDDGRFAVLANDRLMILGEGNATTSFDKHYIYHTAWAARKVKELSPASHVDISSLTYFSTLVSAFIPVRFYDYRPASIELSGLTSGHADLTSLHFPDSSISSLSCMHVVEHIGLGRYGDQLDASGDLVAVNELKRVISSKGSILFVVPIGGVAKVMFNAHRIYTYDLVLDMFQGWKLGEFSLIPDKSSEGIIMNATREQSNLQEYACGCFWFTKP